MIVIYVKMKYWLLLVDFLKETSVYEAAQSIFKEHLTF